MAIVSEVRASRFFVILNPAAGTYTADKVREALGKHFNCADGSCAVHQTSGHENLAELARSAADRGCDVVVAAGGDGTVSAVADGLVGLEIALGIIPLGTANVLARELGIPVDLNEACTLLSGPHAVAKIDAMELAGRHYYTQVGVGIDALMIRDTRREAKKRFGRVAYLWTGFTRLVGFQPRGFRLVVDGREVVQRGSQVVLANCGTLGQHPFRWGPDIRPDDGKVAVCIVRAKTMLHYVQLAWAVLTGQHRQSRHVRYLTSERSVRIETHQPLPVQADGEIVGKTPVEVGIVPGAVRVVVPVGDGGRPG